MADSLFGSLIHMLDPRDMRGISNAIGESEHSISRCVNSCVAAVMGSLASRSGDPGALRRMLDLLPSGTGDISWPATVESAVDPNSPAIGMGKRILSGLFGPAEDRVAAAIGHDSGVRSGVAPDMLAVIAPFVLSFVHRRVRDDGMSMSGLGNLLQRESATIRNAMPGEVRDEIWPRVAAPTTTVPPVTTRFEQRERRAGAGGWALPLALIALAAGTTWWLTHRRPVTYEQARTTTAGRAGRAVPAPAPPAKTIPERMKEAAAPVIPIQPSTIDLKYPLGSSSLTAGSQARLRELAASAAKNPKAHLMVSGYTDNKGDAQRNLSLSQKRADNVMAELARRGVPKERMTAKGYGADNPVATNDTAAGRAQNRHVTVTLE